MRSFAILGDKCGPHPTVLAGSVAKDQAHLGTLDMPRAAGEQHTTCTK